MLYLVTSLTDAVVVDAAEVTVTEVEEAVGDSEVREDGAVKP